MKIIALKHRQSISAQTIIRVLAVSVTVGTLAGCTRKDASSGAETATVAPDPAPAVSPALASPAVNEFGFGALHAGMTYAEANDSLQGALKPTKGANLGECDYVAWQGGPAGLLVMVVANKIARIDIRDSSKVQTDVGAKVGDTEERIKELYGNRVSVMPHKYEDGHYLRVKSANAADTTHFIVFETSHGKVTRFRAGVVPGVDYVEGCS